MKATEDEIVAAALAILNAGGLSALSTRAVAEKLGLSPGNVSYHFPKRGTSSRRSWIVTARATEHASTARSNRSWISSRCFAVFRAQWAWRGLLLALPDVMATWDELPRELSPDREDAPWAAPGCAPVTACTVSDRGDRPRAGAPRLAARVHRALLGERSTGEFYAVWRDQGDRALPRARRGCAPAVDDASRASELEPWLAGWIDIGDS